MPVANYSFIKIRPLRVLFQNLYVQLQIAYGLTRHNYGGTSFQINSAQDSDVFCNHWAQSRHTEWLTQTEQYSLFAHIDLEALAEKLNLLAKQINTDYLPALPLSQIHLTLMSISSTAAISRDTAREVIDTCRESTKALMPVVAQLGELCAWDEGIVIPFQRTPALLELRSIYYRAFRKAISENDLIAGPDFHPHVSIAYANRSAPKAPLLSILAAYQGANFGRVGIDGVDLVTLRRENGQYISTKAN